MGDAVEIEMGDCGDWCGVFLDDSEGRAALELLRVVSEGSDDAAREAGFAGAEGADERDHVARAECFGEASGGEEGATRGAGCDGGGVMRKNVRRHGE